MSDPQTLTNTSSDSFLETVNAISETEEALETNSEVSPLDLEFPSEEETAKEATEDSVATPAPAKEPPPTPEGFVKVRLGEKSYEVPEDGILTIRIDSKDVDVPVKELRRNYQGKIPWERHYGELKKEKLQFQSDLKALDEWIGKVLDLTKTDKKAALLELVTRAGKNPAEYPELFADELEGLDENGQKLVIKQKELEHQERLFQKRKAEEGAKEKKIEEETNLRNYLVTKQAELGVTEEEIEESWALLEKVAEEDVEGELGLNKKTPIELTDLMFNHILKTQRPTKETVSLVKEIAPSISPTQEDLDFLKETISLHKKRYPKSSKADVAEIIKAYYNISESDASVSEDETEAKTIKKSRATPSKESDKESRKATSPKTPQKKDASEDNEDDPKSLDDLLRPYR